MDSEIKNRVLKVLGKVTGKNVDRAAPVIEQLKSLEAKGVHLVVCQTCLNHFGLGDKVEVGIVGGMTDIIEAQWRADKVVTL